MIFLVFLKTKYSIKVNFMFKHFKFKFTLDIIWFAVSGIVSFLFLFFLKKQIDEMYFNVLFGCNVLTLIYFRWILFPGTSFIFSNVLVKVLLWLVNFPLVFFLLQKFNYYMEKIDDYAIHLSPSISFPLADNLDVSRVLWIKNSTLLSFIAVLIIIALMQIRIMWLLMRSIREKYTKDSGY